MNTRHRNLISTLLICTLCLTVYLNSFRCSLHFDDFFAITGNAAVRNLRNFGEIFRLFPGRFILMYSFAVNYYFGKAHPTGYHVANFLFHLANAVLLYFITAAILKSAHTRPAQESADAWPAALLVALVFAAHPVMTESVTYIAGRASSLAAVFFLGSLFLYIHAVLPREDSDPAGRQRPRRLILYLGALLVFFLSLWVKESNITLPVILLTFDFYFVERGDWRRAKNSVLRFVPFLLVLVALVVWRALYFGTVGNPVYVRSVTSNVFTQMRVIVCYLRLIFLPYGQNIDYDFPVSQSLFEPLTFLSFLFLVLLAFSVLLLFKKNKVASFGILWFFITLAPTSSIIPLWDVISERWVYLPAIGIILTVAPFFAQSHTAAVESPRRRRTETLLRPCAIAAILLLSVLTIRRNDAWKSEYTLWKDAAEKSPGKARPHLNLSMALAEMGRLDEAVSEMQAALSLDPKSPEANLSLGALYVRLGRYEDAISQLTATLAMFPDASKIPVRLSDDFAKAHFNLGVAYFYIGNRDRAIAEYKSALQLAPIPWVHSNLGVVYESLGEFELAIKEYQTELALNPGLKQVMQNLENAKRKLEYRNKTLDAKRSE